MDTGAERQARAGVRGEQGAGPGLRDGAGARGRRGDDHRAHAGHAGADRGRDPARDRRRGDGGRRRHHDRGRPRRGAGRLPGPGHPGQQRWRAAAGRLPRVGARRLDPRARRQHADADLPDPRRGGRDDRAAVRPHRQHHLGLGEVADPDAGHEQRRPRRADRLRRRAGAAGGAAQRDHQQPAARAVPDRPAAPTTAGAAAKASGRTVEEELAERAKAWPAGRAGDPAEFGDACVFLCAASSGYIVGQNLLLDGGVFNSTMG